VSAHPSWGRAGAGQVAYDLPAGRGRWAAPDPGALGALGGRSRL